MAKVEKCPACESFYNAGIYSSCPYCASAQGGVSDKTSSKSGQSIKIFGKISSRIKTFGDRVQESKGTEAIYPGMEPSPAEDHKSESAQATQGADSQGAERSPRQALSEEAERLEQPELPAREQIPATPVEASSLESEISKGSRTVGKYIYAKDGAVIEPVVGWIVGVHGDNYGRSFPLKSGKNRIGRTHEMDVRLMNDESVSRACVAIIIYDQRGDEFSVLPGESDSLCYLNDHAIYGRELLEGYDFLEFGDSGLNRYLFVPLCGERFRWKQGNKRTESEKDEDLTYDL